MELIVSNGQRRERVDSAAIEAAVHGLTDPSDFVILRDSAHGEVRAAGPHQTGFLLQYEVTENDTLVRGEADDVSTHEVISILQRFLRGDTRWLSQFHAPVTGGGGRAFALALTAAFTAAVLWFVFHAV